MATVSATAQEKQDELRLRNGTTLQGRLVESDNDTVVFRADGKLKVFKRSEVQRIILAGERDEAQPADATDTADPWGNPPAEYKAKAPHKIKRVIALRRITANKKAEQGKFDPEAAIISADGSKVVFWAPASGLYSINPDGTERNLVWERDDKHHRIRGDAFEISADGKVIFWQSPASGEIRRVDSDGGNEKLLVREGAEYEPMRMRQGGKRLFYGSRRGVFSIDTEGNGDYKEIITHERLGQMFDMEPIHLNEFDVSEDGLRVVLSVWHPKAKKKQLCAIMSNGTEFRQIIKTDFEPTKLSMTPDGEHIIYWKHSEQAYMVDWNGVSLREIVTPPYDINAGGSQFLSRFSPDQQWFTYWGNEGGGGAQITRLDGSSRFEPYNTGRWDNYESSLFLSAWPAHYSANLRHFVFISGWGRPRQVVVGEINPRDVADLPKLTDIEFGRALSTNPQLPNHRTALKARIKKGANDVERVQFLLSPAVQKVSAEPIRWVADRGWWGLQGQFYHLLNDDGKSGDAKANDSLYTTDGLGPDPGDHKPPPGRHLLRIVAHDEQNAVIVDVDGVDIK